MKTVGTYVTREEAEAVRAEKMKRPATPYQDSVSLLHIKNHVGTRKKPLTFSGKRLYIWWSIVHSTRTQHLFTGDGFGIVREVEIEHDPVVKDVDRVDKG
ncbi:hypothetical protein, partial [Faecalibacterium prausnitzii]|uniref:hypothetical protein n=1 Tax=Faecalibacterium prausnitzii TaxID=853 RepID=UPI003F52EBD2